MLISCRGLALAFAVVLSSGIAHAQTPDPAPPPVEQQPEQPPPAEAPPPQAPPPAMATEQPPPPAYPPPGYPPPGYGPPPGYPPPGYYPPGYYPEPPRELDYEEGQPIPPGYRVDTKIRKGLVIAGACVFGGVYLITVIMVSSISPEAVERGNGEEWLYVPLVGPFISIAAIDDMNAGVGALLAINGLAQMGGVAMFIAGLAAKKTVLVRDYQVGSTRVRPLVGPTSAGMQLRF